MEVIKELVLIDINHINKLMIRQSKTYNFSKIHVLILPGHFPLSLQTMTENLENSKKSVNEDLALQRVKESYL